MRPHVSEAVAAAKNDDRGVVALETTITSHLGLPSPANAETLQRTTEAITARGAVPAVTAVLDGQPHVGVDDSVHERLLGAALKTAKRDLAIAIAKRWSFGATTVSASLALAEAAGVDVFATGGIGGVHVGAETSGDVSADLAAIAQHRVVTVCAGAKSFLDLGRTLEHLEMLSVPVIGWRTDRLPGFTAHTAPFDVPARAESADEVALIARDHWSLGGGGLLVVAHAPEDLALTWEDMDAFRVEAEERVASAGITGPAVTPAVLAELSSISAGRTIPANVALAENNADIAAAIAVALHPGG